MTTLPTSTSVLIPPHPGGSRRPLLTPLPEPGHFLMVIDNSSCEKFVTCPQSAYNYLVLGREGQTRSAALTFGGALHAGLEKFLEWQWCQQGAMPATGVTFCNPDAQDLAIVKHFCENPLPLDIFPDYRTVESCLEVMKHYRFQAQLPDYQWEILSDDKGPVIERAFELPLGVLEVGGYIAMPWLSPAELEKLRNNGDVHSNGTCYVKAIHVAWSGRVDAIVHANGMARICDHKTASDKRYLNPQKYHLANQTIGYVWAAKQLFPSLDVKGFLLNGIIFRKPTGAGSIFDKGPRGGEPALTFARYYYEYSDERLLWWANNALTIVSDFIHCLTRNEFPSHTAWCHGTYGPCPYLEVCEQDSPAMRKALIQSDRYKTVTWNPVK